MLINADVAELADALVLGTSVNDVGVQVPSSAPIVNLFESTEKKQPFYRLLFIYKNYFVVIIFFLSFKYHGRYASPNIAVIANIITAILNA